MKYEIKCSEKCANAIANSEEELLSILEKIDKKLLEDEEISFREGDEISVPENGQVCKRYYNWWDRVWEDIDPDLIIVEWKRL